jgi:hypothetical protein
MKKRKTPKQPDNIFTPELTQDLNENYVNQWVAIEHNKVQHSAPSLSELLEKTNTTQHTYFVIYIPEPTSGNVELAFASTEHK